MLTPLPCKNRAKTRGQSSNIGSIYMRRHCRRPIISRPATTCFTYCFLSARYAAGRCAQRPPASVTHTPGKMHKHFGQEAEQHIIYKCPRKRAVFTSLVERREGRLFTFQEYQSHFMKCLSDASFDFSIAGQATGHRPTRGAQRRRRHRRHAGD